MQELLTLAKELGLTVIERKGAKRGGYHDSSKTIRLNPSMSWRLARSILAHEIGHAVYGDEHSMFGPERARQEKRADEWAARHLITPASYAEAEARRGVHAASLAHDLGVTVELVEAYQRVLQRIGNAVYVEPRMGAGQFLHRIEVA